MHTNRGVQTHSTIRAIMHLWFPLETLFLFDLQGQWHEHILPAGHHTSKNSMIATDSFH